MRLGVVMRIVLALTLVGAVIYGWHWWLIDRLIDAPAWPGAWTPAAKVGVGVLGALMPLSMLAQRSLPPRLARWIGWPASVWMGVAWIALATLAVVELVGLFAPAYDPRARALTVLGATLLGTAWGMARAFRPRVVDVDIEIANWPSALDGFSIVQLSDVHIGPMLGAGFARRLADRVNALEPDLAVLTGDLVDGSVAHVGEMVGPLADLQAKHGRFFVTGNHDFYSGADPWCARVEALGFEVLRNTHVRIQDAGATFALAGVDDHRGDPMTGERGEDLEAALSGIAETTPTVLLAHDPATFRRARSMGVDLQISGHTHGGQIWPFRYLVRATVKWVAGLYREGRAQIYVSRGTGFWGPPIRIGAPGEITRLRIRRG